MWTSYRSEDDVADEQSQDAQQISVTRCTAYETVLRRANIYQQSQDDDHVYDNIPLQHLQSHPPGQAAVPTKQMAYNNKAVSVTTAQDPSELSSAACFSSGLQCIPQVIDDDDHVYVTSDITSAIPRYGNPTAASTSQEDAIYENLKQTKDPRIEKFGSNWFYGGEYTWIQVEHARLIKTAAVHV